MTELAALTCAPPASDAASAGGRPLEVSVVVPVYNRSALLRRALGSVASQRPRSAAEVIVVDDGSTEDLGEAIGRFDVKFIRHPENRGLSAARNTGVAAASYPWVALLDSDDEWLPHHLATLWPLRGEHLLVASSALRRNGDPSRDRVQGPARGRAITLSSPAALLFPDNFICPSAVMVRRDAVRAAGGFEAHDGVVEDLYLWCRLLERGTGVASPVVSLLYHVHADQMSGDLERMQSAHLSVARSFAGRGSRSKALVERRQGMAAWTRLRAYSARSERVRALRMAAAILRHPQRVVGVGATWLYRLRVRRRTSQVQRDGRPSVAVLGGGDDSATRAIEALRSIATGDPQLEDWRGLSGSRSLARLARRPTAVAVVHSRAQAAVVSVTGARPVAAAAICAAAASAGRSRQDPRGS